MVFLHSHGAIESGEGEVQGLYETEAEFLGRCGRNLLIIEPSGPFIVLNGLKSAPELTSHIKVMQTRRKNILLLTFISEKKLKVLYSKTRMTTSISSEA